MRRDGRATGARAEHRRRRRGGRTRAVAANGTDGPSQRRKRDAHTHIGVGGGARYRACIGTAAAAACVCVCAPARAWACTWGGMAKRGAREDGRGAARRTVGGGVIVRRVGVVVVVGERARAELVPMLRRHFEVELAKRLEEVRLVAALRRRAARGDARGGVRGGGCGGRVRLGAVVVAVGRDAHLRGGGALHRAPPVLRCAALCARA